MRALGATPGGSVLVGDSTSDMRAAGVLALGYATDADQRARLVAGGAGAVTDHMADLAVALRSG
jgi:hypothetical protein